MEWLFSVFVPYSKQHENTLCLKCMCMTDQEKKRWRHCFKKKICCVFTLIERLLCVCAIGLLTVCVCAHKQCTQSTACSSVHTCLESTCPRVSFLRRWPLVKPLFSALMMSSSQRWERWTLSWGTAALIMGNNAGKKKKRRKKKNSSQKQFKRLGVLAAVQNKLLLLYWQDGSDNLCSWRITQNKVY